MSACPSSAIHVGTAGWAIPALSAEAFPSEGTHLQRYSSRLDVAEINSSFHRPHRRSTYERWAASVPAAFRFAVKLPRTITHDRRFVACEEPVARFAEETGGLGERRGPLLVQLPPSFAWPGDPAERFFDLLAREIGGAIVVEPRHASWFDDSVGRVLESHRVARVAADPSVTPAAAEPGGWRGLAYFRLHGSPHVYRSAYGAAAAAVHGARVAQLAANGAEVWTIYDNTASGAATGDALALRDAVSGATA